MNIPEVFVFFAFWVFFGVFFLHFYLEQLYQFKPNITQNNIGPIKVCSNTSILEIFVFICAMTRLNTLKTRLSLASIIRIMASENNMNLSKVRDDYWCVLQYNCNARTNKNSSFHHITSNQDLLLKRLLQYAWIKTRFF